MERRALLIACGTVPGQDRLLGAYQDIRALRSYLESIEGGAWYSNEVHTLVDPESDEVLRWVQWAHQAGFSFISFSGHGSQRITSLHPRRTDAYALCADNRSIPRSSLKARSGRRVILLDSCREVEELAKAAVLEGLAQLPSPQLDWRMARRLYEAQVLRCHEYNATVFGSTFNGLALDSPSFTSALVGTGMQWARGDVPDGGVGILTIGSAFSRARTEHVLNHPGYHPQIVTPGRVRANLPFAVGLF